MLLSILIPTLPDRKHFLTELFTDLNAQITNLNASDKVQILTDHRPRIEDGGVTTGEKRNDLYERANGLLSMSVDDDDKLFPNALKLLLEAAAKNPDCIGINGTMTTDGKNEQGWEIRLGHPFLAVKKQGFNGEYYLRHPNHITPIRTEFAKQIKFRHITVHEDYNWAVALKDSGLLKTQVIIDEPIYHYRVRSKK